MMIRPCAILSAAGLTAIAGLPAAHAGLEGVYIIPVPAEEVDAPAGYQTWRAVAVFTEESDFVLAVGASEEPPLIPLVFNTDDPEGLLNLCEHEDWFFGECLWYEDFPGSPPPPAWDSYVTIDNTTFTHSAAYSDGFLGGGGDYKIKGTHFEADEGGWFDSDPGIPADAGPDLQVIIAQFTVREGYCVELSGAIFVDTGGGIETASFSALCQVSDCYWSENFEAYVMGPLIDQSDWEAWNDLPEASDFLITHDQALSMPRSLAIDGDDDAVHRFTDFTSGTRRLSAAIFVPEEMNDVQAFILLNEYPADDAHDWSLQLEIDGINNVIADLDSAAELPLVKGRWSEITVNIDLDADLQSVFYEGQHLLTKNWTGGVEPGGALNLAAVDLFGNGSAAPVYYDDFCLGDPLEVSCVGDLDLDGAVAFGDLVSLLGQWGDCPAPCPGDLNGDGEVSFPDLLILIANWGTCA